MKTPQEWKDFLHEENFLTTGCEQWTRISTETIEAIQRDAQLLSFTDTTAQQQELETIKDISGNLECQLQIRTQELAEMREKWLQARKHLRAANKGAERNAQALALATTRYWDYRDSDRRYKERDENNHKTVVWNWLLMSDDEYRLKCGELSSQDLRNIRAVLKAMLGTSLIKHL